MIPDTSSEAVSKDPETSSHTQDGSREGDQIRALARFATLILLILGMFVFGLTGTEAQDEGGSVLNVKWLDLVAIFFVFLLADLGAELMARAAEIGSNVSAAASRVSAAAASAIQARDETRKAVNELTSSSSALVQITNLERELSGTVDLHEAIADLSERLGVSREGSLVDLANMVYAWSGNPRVLEKPYSQEFSKAVLFEHVFEKLSDPRIGAVKTKGREITCITSDEVFCALSEAWLRSLVDYAKARDGQVFVLAVTTLPPIKFALPELWWGASSRVSVLEGFVSEVIDACRDQDHVAGYSRVTVRAQSQEMDETLRKLDFFSDEDFEREILSRVYVWDKRLVQVGSPFHKFMVSDMENFARGAGERIGSVEEDQIDEHTKRPKTSEEIYGWLLDTKKFYPLGERAFFCAETSDAGIARVKSMATAGYRTDGRVGMKVKDDWSAEELYGWTGFMPLGLWYQAGLHCGDSVAAKKFRVEGVGAVGAFSVEWGDQKWYPFDTLLVGVRRDGEETSWCGALIADLDLQDPACIVRVVCDETKCEAIARKVQQWLTEGEKWPEDTCSAETMREVLRRPFD